MKIIDGHIHIFSTINGANLNGKVKNAPYGKINNAGIVTPFIPPLNEKTCFTAEMILEMMEQNGVECCILFQNPTIGFVNDEVGQAILKYPNKFSGLVQIDPYQKDAEKQADLLLKKYPFSALKLEMSTGWGWSGIYHDSNFKYEKFLSIIDFAEKNNIPVVIDTGDTKSFAYKPDELGNIIKKFKKVHFVIEHGGSMTPEGDEDLWQKMVKLGLNENVYMGISAMPILLNDPYPCDAANNLLKRIVKLIGSDKLIWGTDAPTTLKMYTYRQLIDWVLIHSDFISEDEKENIFFSNAEKLYFHGG